MIKSLKCLSVVATVTMIFVLIGGALVTKTGSGMGCGANWPICEGELSKELIIELSHRLVSGAAGIIVLLLSVLAWKYFGHIREVKFLSFISLFFLVLQGLIGAAAVLWAQSDFILALHFGISLISFAAVFLLTILIFEIDHRFDADSLHIDKNFRTNIYSLILYTLVVVYTGALVRHTNASLACLGWPVCSNEQPFLLNFQPLQWIQMGHRFAASIAVIWTILLFIRALRHYRTNRIMVAGWGIAVSLLISQVTTGALIIFTRVNLTISLLHALIITLFFGVLSYFVLLSSRSAKAEKNKKIDTKRKNAVL